MLDSIHKEEDSLLEDAAFLKHRGDPLTFNLEEKIRILLIEKEIHRFLNEYLGKKEEDKNDTKNMSSHSSHFFCLNLFGADKQAGYVLLDKVISTFKGMAAKGTGSREKVIPALEEMMADAKKVKGSRQIDAVFFNRYNRLLMVMRLFLVEDEEGILGPVIEREVEEFIWDVEEIKLDSSGKKAIGSVSQAIADELVNLHLYLDNIEKKQELKKKLEEMGSGEKKK